MTSKKKPKSIVHLAGLPIEIIRSQHFVDRTIDDLKNGDGGWCCTVNLDIFRQWYSSPEVRGLLNGVTSFVADGTPILWASQLRGVTIPERVCGSDLIYSLTEAAAKAGKSVYLIGGNPGTAEQAAHRLVELYPNLVIAGIVCPPIGFESSPHTIDTIIENIVVTKPDIVFVGLGFPKQERLIFQLRRRHPTAWYCGVGISFSMVAGEVKRAPLVLQNLGLEWAHRLFQEPSRLWKRYLIQDLPFAFFVAWKLLREKDE